MAIDVTNDVNWLNAHGYHVEIQGANNQGIPANSVSNQGVTPSPPKQPWHPSLEVVLLMAILLVAVVCLGFAIAIYHRRT